MAKPPPIIDLDIPIPSKDHRRLGGKAARIRELLDGTRTAREIAVSVGVKQKRVWTVACQADLTDNIKRVGGGRRDTRGTLGAIIAAASPDLTTRELADKLGLDLHYVRAVVSKHALPFKPERQGSQVNTPHALTPTAYSRKALRNKEIAEALRAGAKLKTLADKYGISRERVRQIGLRSGLYSARSLKNQDRSPSATTQKRAAQKERQEAKHAREKELLEEMQVLVLSGMSIAHAGRRLGLKRGLVHKLSKQGAFGAITTYGRWRSTKP